MKIAIATDHRGYALKERLVTFLERLGHEVFNKGPFSEESIDYPPMAHAVALTVAEGEVDRGILLCGTGIGVSIAANKVPGVRASLCHDEFTTEFSRRHNNANVFCFGSDVVSEENVRELLKLWLTTDFEDELGSRHVRRVNQMEPKG